MSGKELKRILSEVQNLSYFVSLKTERLSNTEGLIDRDELVALEAEHTESKNLHNSLLSDDFHQREDYLDAHGKSLEESHLFLRRLDERLDQWEQTFHRYNVPRVSELSCPKDCSVAVKRFMRVWREESQRGRERGWKNLNEWMIRCPGQEIPARLAVISLGTRISCCVAAYFALIAESSSDKEKLRRKIRMVVAAIQCLKVEEDRSTVVIDMFLLAASYAETTTRIGDAECFRSGVSMKMESDLVHLILREILRLEVAFSCPNLPMMVSEKVLTGMVNHLECVFVQKLNRVWFIMDKLAKELGLLIGDNGYWEAPNLYNQINEVWSKLDLISSGESSM